MDPRRVYPPRALDLDVVVGHGGVDVFANGSDFMCTTDEVFPQPAGSAIWGDEISCHDSCVSRLAVGSISTTPMFRAPYHLDVDVTAQPDAVLEIEGCHGSARIPIGALGSPQPTASAARDAVATTVHVSWSAPHARTAVLWFEFAFWTEVRHVTDPDYVFVPAFAGAQDATGVLVETLGGVIPVATDFGVVRVWPGESTFVMLPPVAQ